MSKKTILPPPPAAPYEVLRLPEWAPPPADVAEQKTARATVRPLKRAA